MLSTMSNFLHRANPNVVNDVNHTVILILNYCKVLSTKHYKYKYKWEFVERGLQIVQGH